MTQNIIYCGPSSFCIKAKSTFGNMAEELKACPELSVTPPLRLKDLGIQEPCLVYLSQGM